jgi:hypothetical protein
MNKQQLLSAVMAGALALYAPVSTDAATSGRAKVVTPGKGKGKAVVSPLEKKLSALDNRVVGLAQDVTQVNAQYNALGARVDELAKNDYLNADLRAALAEKYGELQGLHQAVDDECGKAYAGFVRLAEQVSATYKDAEQFTTKVSDLGKDKKLSNYNKAVKAEQLFLAELKDADNSPEFVAYLGQELTATTDEEGSISVVDQHKKCVEAQEKQVDGVRQLKKLYQTNLLRTPEELEAIIEAVVDRKLPKVEPSKWSIKALAGAGYFGNGTAHSFPVAVTGELCYAFTPAISLCANGTVYQNGESTQTETSTPESKTSAVGGSLGYQQQSTLSLQKTTGTDYHNGAGLRLAYNANRNVGFGLSLQAMNGQGTTIENKTRSVVLLNSTGVQLGNASSIEDSVTTRKAVHPIVPGVDLTVESAKGFGARLSAGYDLMTGKVMGFIQGLYRF